MPVFVVSAAYSSGDGVTFECSQADRRRLLAMQLHRNGTVEEIERALTDAYELGYESGYNYWDDRR